MTVEILGRRVDDEVEAEGSVRLEQGDDVVAGPKMRLKIEDQVGYFEQPSYTIRRKSPAVLAAEAARTGGRAEQAQADDWLNSGFASPRALNIAVGQATLGDTTRMLSGLSDGRGDRRLEDAVLDLHGKLQSHPFPEKWAAEAAASLDVSGLTDAGETAWGAELLRRAADSGRDSLFP